MCYRTFLGAHARTQKANTRRDGSSRLVRLVPSRLVSRSCGPVFRGPSERPTGWMGAPARRDQTDGLDGWNGSTLTSSSAHAASVPSQGCARWNLGGSQRPSAHWMRCQSGALGPPETALEGAPSGPHRTDGTGLEPPGTPLPPAALRCSSLPRPSHPSRGWQSSHLSFCPRPRPIADQATAAAAAIAAVMQECRPSSAACRQAVEQPTCWLPVLVRRNTQRHRNDSYPSTPPLPPPKHRRHGAVSSFVTRQTPAAPFARGGRRVVSRGPGRRAGQGRRSVRWMSWHCMVDASPDRGQSLANPRHPRDGFPPSRQSPSSTPYACTRGGWCASSRLGPITPRSPALPSPLDPAEATREPPPPLERPDATIAIRPCVPHQSPAKPSKAQPRRLVRLQTVPLASSHRRLDLLARPPASLARQCRPRVNAPLDLLRGSTKPESTGATRGWLAPSSAGPTSIHPSSTPSRQAHSPAPPSHMSAGTACRVALVQPFPPVLRSIFALGDGASTDAMTGAMPCHATPCTKLSDR